MPRLPAEGPTGDRYWRALGLSQLLKLCLCPVEQLGGAVITADLPTVNLIAHVPEKARRTTVLRSDAWVARKYQDRLAATSRRETQPRGRQWE